MSYFVVFCCTVSYAVKVRQSESSSAPNSRTVSSDALLGQPWICNTPTQLDVNRHYFHRAGSGCRRSTVARDIASNDTILEREASARQSYADSSAQLQTMALGGVAVDALRLTDSVALASQRAAGAQKFHRKHQQVSTPHFSGSVTPDNASSTALHTIALHSTPLPSTGHHTTPHHTTQHHTTPLH